MVSFVGSNSNWKVVALCVGASYLPEIVFDKFTADPKKNSTTEKAANQAVRLVTRAGLTILMTKALAAYSVVVITLDLVVKIAAVQLLIHLASKPLLSQTAPRVKEPTTSKEPPELNSLKSLVDYYDPRWNGTSKEFEKIECNGARAIGCLKKFEKLSILKENYYGYIAKQEVPEGSKVFVRADLHGDLKSLIENLKTMQSKGFLDKDFKCNKDMYMVFCGDYMDRGSYSLEVAELLATLKLENDGQVFLIRGNHEYIATNTKFSGANFPEFLEGVDLCEALQALHSFYNSMPLTLYLSQKGGEFVQFTHGLFELYVDPSEMLDSEGVWERMFIPEENDDFSERIKNLAKKVTQGGSKTEEKAHQAAKRIIELKSQEKARGFDSLTAYNWGDVKSDPSSLGDLGSRKWHLHPDDVKHALRLMGNKRKVKLLFRGHQHTFKHSKAKGKIVVTTLPIGDNLSSRLEFDRAYILEVKPKVKDWQKQAFSRKFNGTGETVTSWHNIFSEEI